MAGERATLRTAASVAAGAFLVSLLFQGFLWGTLDAVTDSGDIWAPTIAETAARGLPPTTEMLYGYPAPTLMYPGIPLVLAGSVLVRTMGISPDAALRIVLALFISLAIAFAGLLCYLLRPGVPWYAGVVALFALTRVYQGATPPSSILLSLAPSFLLSVWLAHERKRAWWPYILLGLVGGFALSIRFDISAALLACGLLFLVPGSPKRTIGAGCIALITFIGLDPYLWTHPIQYIVTIISVIHTVYGSSSGSFALRPLLVGMPFAIFTLIYSVLVAGIMPRLMPLPRPILYWVWGTTAMLGSVLLIAGYHPVWYFYPLLALWQALCPLFLFAIAGAIAEERKWNVAPVRTAAWVVGILGAAQLASFAYLSFLA